jgi:hypothetical protein
VLDFLRFLACSTLTSRNDMVYADHAFFVLARTVKWVCLAEPGFEGGRDALV